MRSDSVSIGVGEVVEVPLLLENVYEAYAIDVQMHFDPNLIEVVDADGVRDEIQVRPGDFPQPDFQARNTVDNAAGRIHYVATQINPTPPASGSGTVFTILLRAKDGGETILSIDLVEISNRDGQLLDVSFEDVRVSLSGGDGKVTPGAAIVLPTLAATEAKKTPQSMTAPTTAPTNVPPPSVSPVENPSSPGSLATSSPAVNTPVSETQIYPDLTLTEAVVSNSADSTAEFSPQQNEITTSAETSSAESQPGDQVFSTPAAANDEAAAPIALQKGPSGQNDELATPVMISAPGNNPARHNNQNGQEIHEAEIEGSNERTVIFLIIALVVLAAGAVGLIFVLNKNRSAHS